jgi:hypothetical protein
MGEWRYSSVLKLGTIVSFMHLPFYPRGNDPQSAAQVLTANGCEIAVARKGAIFA